MHKWMQISNRTNRDNSLSAFRESDFDAGGRVRAGWGAPPPLHKFGLVLAEPAGPRSTKMFLCPPQPITLPPTKVETCSIRGGRWGGKHVFWLFLREETQKDIDKSLPQLEQTRTATNATQPRKKNILRDTSIYINVESSPQNFIMQVSSDELKYMGR